MLRALMECDLALIATGEKNKVRETERERNLKVSKERSLTFQRYGFNVAVVVFSVRRGAMLSQQV